ncbi:DUF805 domain-containing protein [Brevundimonas sp. SL130]|uniref:DUF805 domain-containing protein n=1 Tax=Brevundimonas sp. SL130 TaxID=2995143 RepID=UPI00226C8803|nr:DUF805 domain-containing protein [Brevundimonas sp. SL130]WAC59418.1 DUF805 domain-containing protein [Brevundimonas sp. SL130]
MRGEILSYDTTAGTGLISGDDGVRYSFVSSGLQSPAVPAAGVRVDFVPEGEEATQILILAGAPSTVGVAGGLAASSDNPVAGLDWQKLLFAFEGRTRRSHFWIGWLILLGVGVVAGWLPIIGSLISLALIWPNLAISVKRLHDMGKTGWLIAIPWASSVVFFIVGFVMVVMAAVANGMTDYDFDEDPAAMLALIGPGIIAFLLSAVVPLIFLLWIGLVDSQKGDNRYGPNSKGE